MRISRCERTGRDLLNKGGYNTANYGVAEEYLYVPLSETHRYQLCMLLDYQFYRKVRVLPDLSDHKELSAYSAT